MASRQGPEGAPVLSDRQLSRLAGHGAFRRGVGYFREGRVHLLRSLENGFDAEAEGTRTYRLSLKREAGDWVWNCECPAGGFCKHLVAAALAWRDGEREWAPSRDELLEFLKAQPAERLAQWLHQLANEDPAIEKRLNLLASQDDPAQLKKALGAMLTATGFMDWRRNDAFARRLDAPLRALESLLGTDPAQCLALCDYALGRLLRVYRRSDDSSGGLGERIREFAVLHQRAAEIGIGDAKAFARELFKWQQADDWDFFPLEAYWEALGEAGRTRYAALVEAEFAALPTRPASIRDVERWGEELGPVRRMEALARMQREFPTLLRVLSRDLSSGRAYEEIVLACREFGHEREALQWAERGVKAHPDSHGLRPLLAEELQRAGMTDEAADTLWHDFQRHPGESTWLRLKGAAGKDWPALRARALAHAQRREKPAADGRQDVSLRLGLLLADNDLEAARVLAASAAARPGKLETLAERIERTHPEDAAALFRRVTDSELSRADAGDYARLVERMARIVRRDPGPATRDWLVAIKSQYRTRRKLMALMDARGLGDKGG